ncbi:MAG: SusD/RagB family nutrient-binding outer membrane lipoprotein, partial [Sediminibacterium sp.]|nr:SusD/RagB family nutrient-binding outer membrane lipoprotein [Sediminibacterium sp.]
KNNKIILFANIAIMLFLISCKKDITDLNINKNAATSIDPLYLVSTGLLRIGGEYENTRAVSIYASPLIQHTASTSNLWSGDKYWYNPEYSGAYMERHFTDVIKLFSQAISLTKDKPSLVNINAMATILRVFDLHRMTDLYGDIPYTQAGYGLIDKDANWFPKYENQKDVYDAMIKDLKEARDKLTVASTSVVAINPKQDFIYGGDISKWKKFANALLMRMALRISNVDSEKAKVLFNEANGNTFTANEDNALINYLEGPQGVNRNGLNDGYFGGRKYMISESIRVSKTFVNWMKTNNDPRLLIVCGGIGNPQKTASWNTDTAKQFGMPNGFTSANIADNLGSPSATALYKTSGDNGGANIFSFLNLNYLDWSDPYMLITFAEIELMRAEAALKGWTADNAETRFNNGIKAAIKNWTSFDASFSRSDAVINTYITNRGFASKSTIDKLKLIGEEYWAATYLNDIESWCNWRRTGYPVLTPTNDANQAEPNTGIPRRLRYWENEASSNPSNYKVAVTRMGNDLFATKLWWDGGK